jgi:glyoxylase-like metal-dependent hydrolase (beta-lactamase superfamily II)
MDWEKIYEGNLVEIFRITPRLYFRKADLHTRGQCNGAFIVGDAGVAVVDAPPGAAEMYGEAERLFHKPITAVFLTHGHGDHAEGLGDFIDRDMTVYCSRCLLETLTAGGASHRAAIAGVDGTLTLNFSGVPVECLTLGNTAHSKWDMFIRLPEAGVLCTGDSVVEFQTAFFHGADITSWIPSLRRLGGINCKYILSGHGPSLFPYSYLDEFTDFLSRVERAARASMKRYRPDPALDDKQRFADISAEKAAALVEEYWAERNGDTVFLEEKAGAGDAKREVRMVQWEFIREFIR